MISSPWLQGRDRYERTFESWTDSTYDDAFTHTIRVADDDFAFEARTVSTPSPGYEIREASARVMGGRVGPGLADGFSTISNTRMAGGFTKALAEALGSGPGADLLLMAGVEMARLARQITKLPRELTAGLQEGDARRYWDLDNAGWEDIPGSCFAYSPQGRSLFDTRTVTTLTPTAIYRAPTGQMKIFRRKKLLRMVRTEHRLHLFHSMHDTAHGFDVHYEIDLPSGRIKAADSIWSRLPYLGICDEPQAKITAMNGQIVDGELRKRIKTILGGEAGCSQLYDLTSDLLKLLHLS